MITTINEFRKIYENTEIPLANKYPFIVSPKDVTDALALWHKTGSEDDRNKLDDIIFLHNDIYAMLKLDIFLFECSQHDRFYEVLDELMGIDGSKDKIFKTMNSIDTKFNNEKFNIALYLYFTENGAQTSKAVEYLTNELAAKMDYIIEEKAANILSGATQLRKLTKKSTLKFGKWADLTIENLLKMEKQYLRWVYYNSSNIDFMDDVLDELGITTEFKIQKPGKDTELGKTAEIEIKKIEKAKDVSLITKLNAQNKNKIKSDMDKENIDKVSADTDSPYTDLKFGKLAGGRSIGRRKNKKLPN